MEQVHPKYRPDIDGLRAVAVIAVVIFHLFRGALPAGFLGVDVFFVISGYLITLILVRECETKKYSIKTFYVRRVKRIFPNLILVVIVTDFFVIATYLSADIIGYGKSVLFTFLFLSNIYFWRDTNYFSEDAGTKPLLHTWSLGVEEQFYILFPIVILLLMRVGGRRATLLATIGLTVLSFAAASLALIVNKDIVAFYLLPMRAWELGIGGIVALRARPFPLAGWITQAIALAALALLIASLALLDPLSYRPLPAAIFACVATALLIATGQMPTLAARILGWRPFVAVGLISYSLYLWHWPVYVIARYLLIREPTTFEAIGLVALAAGLAVMSWHWVERPFRGQAVPTDRVMAICGAGTAVLMGVAFALIATDGLPSRFGSRVAVFNALAGTHYRCPVRNYVAFGRLYACSIALPDNRPVSADVVLLGNSHAQMYAPAFARALEARGLHGLLVPSDGCLPTRTFNISAACLETTRDNLDAVAALPQVRVVVIAFRWPVPGTKIVYAAGRSETMLTFAQLSADIKVTIAALSRAGKRVVLVGPIPYPGYDVASVASRQLAFYGRVSAPLSQSRAEFDRAFGPVEAWLARGGVADVVIEPGRWFCGARRCSYLLDGRPAFADDNHLAASVAVSFAPLFGAAIDQAIGRAPGMLVHPVRNGATTNAGVGALPPSDR